MASIYSDIDGGHARLILVACMVLTCFENIATAGIFYMAILEKYKRDHYATIWIQTLQTGMLYLAGIMAGVTIEKKGYKFTAILAGITYTLSFLTSYFASTLEVLYVSFGIATGFSQSLLNVVAFAIVPYYFEKRLGMAIGFTQAGVGIGLVVFSALNTYLVVTYGLQGTLLILAGIAAHTIPLGMMMQKPPDINKHVGKVGNKKAKLDVCNERKSLLTEEEQLLLKNSNSVKENEFEIAKNYSNLSSDHDMMPKNKDNFCCCDIASISYTTGLDLFNNKYYTMLIVATAFIILPHNVVPTIIPDHMKWTGATEIQVTSSLVIIGVANTVSRLFFWKFSKDEVLHTIDILTISSLLSGTGLVCTLFLYEYWMYVIFCILFGITRGVFMIYQSLLLIQIVGKERAHHGYGVSLTVRGIIVLIGMSSVGAVTDATYNKWWYNVVFLSLGGCEIVAGFILIALRILYRNVPVTVQY